MQPTDRAALINELAEAIHAADEQNGHMHYARKHVHAIMPIIDRLLTTVRRAAWQEFEEALLEAADGYIVAKGQDGEAEGAFATKPWMVKILDTIDLAEEGAE